LHYVLVFMPDSFKFTYIPSVCMCSVTRLCFCQLVAIQVFHVSWLDVIIDTTMALAGFCSIGTLMLLHFICKSFIIFRHNRSVLNRQPTCLVCLLAARQILPNSNHVKSRVLTENVNVAISTLVWHDE